MIAKKQIRYKDGENFVQDTVFFVTPEEALENMVAVELAFGASVEEISSSRVLLKTDIMGCVDTSEFVGEEKEMEPLLSMAGLFCVSSESCQNAIVKNAAEEICKLKNLNFLGMAAPIFIGKSRMKVAFVFALGFSQEMVSKALESKKSLKDILAAHQLAKEGLCSFEEALLL